MPDKDNFDHCYVNYKREIKKQILPLNIYFIEGEQVCMSWAGSPNHPKEACVFLATSSFGVSYKCIFTGEILKDVNGAFSIHTNCPLRYREDSHVDTEGGNK